MKKIWMLAALLLCFACVGCSDDDDPEPAQFSHVKFTLTLEASEGARQLLTFSGKMIGSEESEMLITSAEIEALNYSSPNTIEFNYEEDAPTHASLWIFAEKKTGFQSSSAKADVRIKAELLVTAYDNQGNELATAISTKSFNLTNATLTEELQESLLNNFPITRTIRLKKGSEGYELTILDVVAS